MAYTDSLTMGSSQDSHLWMVYGYICRNGNSSARILLGVRIRIMPCTPHGKCGLTMVLGVYRLKSVELRCQLCLLFYLAALQALTAPLLVSYLQFQAPPSFHWLQRVELQHGSMSYSVKKWTTHGSAPHVATLVLKALKASHAHLPNFKVVILLFPCGNYNSSSQPETHNVH